MDHLGKNTFFDVLIMTIANFIVMIIFDLMIVIVKIYVSNL
jgi:hypothetical protein